jgi:hypothetical protein
MSKRALALLVSGLLAALLAPMAVAKGPSEATLEGPGLGSPIEFGGFWRADGKNRQPLQPFLVAFGFFPAAFGTPPEPYFAARLPGRPQRDLGPRYTVTYVLNETPDDEGALVVQDLYPYAKPNAVTYMAPDQEFWGTVRTRGGWFVARSAGWPQILADAGLPRTPPRADGDREIPWTALGAIAALALGGALTVLAFRHRPQPA